MKLDDIDTKILKLLGLLKKSTTTTEMAKELFAPKDDYELKKRDNFIRMRLKKLSKLSLVEAQEKNGHTNYSICKNCWVLSGTPKISINGNVFEGQKGQYVFIVKEGRLEQILS